MPCHSKTPLVGKPITSQNSSNNHPYPFYYIQISLSVVLFVFGIHKLVIAPQIITSRMRSVLGDFNMSCDDTGKLILKPRPNNN